LNDPQTISKSIDRNMEFNPGRMMAEWLGALRAQAVSHGGRKKEASHRKI
jgi:hypothetical protein